MYKGERFLDKCANFNNEILLKLVMFNILMKFGAKQPLSDFKVLPVNGASHQNTTSKRKVLSQNPFQFPSNPTILLYFFYRFCGGFCQPQSSSGQTKV